MVGWLSAFMKNSEPTNGKVKTQGVIDEKLLKRIGLLELAQEKTTETLAEHGKLIKEVRDSVKRLCVPVK